MPEFRKWILVLAAVTLFAGLASAQVTGGNGGSSQLNCSTTNGAVTPTIRNEGYTELVGDILIVCTGGPSLATGSVIPTVNLTIFMNANVTSRLLAATTGGNVSEALLLIDEPGSALSGYGPQQQQLLCSTPAYGSGPGGSCVEYVGNSTTGGTGVPVQAPNSVSSPTTAPGWNVFQGVVTGAQQVTFFGVPVLAPSTSGNSRVFRITNIRVNANQIVAGGAFPGQATASISASPASSLPITTSTLTVAFTQQGLNPTNTGLRNTANTGSGGGTFNQCSSATLGVGGGLLQFQENFATAFKTRVSSGQTGGTVSQNIPGQIYNSESGFIFPVAQFSGSVTGTSTVAGLADYGTRLKAVFSNVPSGVSIFVSTRDVSNAFSIYGSTANAVLVVSENAPDSASLSGTGNSTTVGLGGIPLAAQTGVGPSQTSSSGTNPVGLAPVVVSNGLGTATWEVINTNPSTIDTLLFSVYISYTATPANNSPAAPSSMSVTLEFAPTPTGGQFTTSTGAVASNSLTIPRFSDTLAISKTYGSFALCTTNLLYPYVINTNGFDTGLAIANTTSDPFGTTAQVGTCSLNFYGSTAPAASFTTPSIASGTVYANLASTVSPGFSGYIIAVCNFQFAHGFAFVSDVGARNLAMGYLALILPTPRSATEALNN